MSKKKQAREQLINTHVINIKEIRDAEKEEKHIKFKRKPLLYTFIGILLIVGGLMYPTIKTIFKSDEAKVFATKANKNSLTCISNYSDKSNNIKIYTKTIYTFNKNKLARSESSTDISLINGNDLTYLNQLRDKYNTIYISNNNIKYSINVTDKLTITTSINNYNGIDYTTYNSEINTLTHTIMFKGGESMNRVNDSLEKIGNLCN